MTNTIPAWLDGKLVALDKIEVHRRGLRHPAVSVFVMAGDAVLLQRRAMGKYHTPGLWTNTCCTHPAMGEAARDCATRRLGEELGITGLAPEFRDRIEYRADVGGGLTEHEVVDLFVASSPSDLPLSPDPAEVMETAWCPIPELAGRIAAAPQSFTPWMRIYMADHAERILGLPA